MSGVNRCQFIGNLGRDVDSKTTANGTNIANFSIGCSEVWKDQSGQKQESTEWVNITAFGKLAEICTKYLQKGSKVYIEGKFKTDKYEKDGQTLYSTKIIASNLVMLGGKPSGQSNQSSQKPQTPVSDDTSFDDDIPFS